MWETSLWHGSIEVEIDCSGEVGLPRQKFVEGILGKSLKLQVGSIGMEIPGGCSLSQSPLVILSAGASADSLQRVLEVGHDLKQLDPVLHHRFLSVRKFSSCGRNGTPWRTVGQPVSLFDPRVKIHWLFDRYSFGVIVKRPSEIEAPHAMA